MSNSYENKRTWEIDTAVDVDGVFLVDDFTWHPSAKGQDLDIEDTAENDIWTTRSVASASNHEAYGIETKVYGSKSPLKCRGIHIKTIDGGLLYVHLNDASPLA